MSEARPQKPVIAYPWVMPTESNLRKRFPITTGFLDYFPSAAAAVSYVSWAGNQKHNPGQPLHWARGKSTDQEDCIGRHLLEREGFEAIETADAIIMVPCAAQRAWRAMAALQLLCEERGAPVARGAR